MVKRPIAPALRSRLQSAMRCRATLTITEAVKLIEPYYEFDPTAARIRAVRRYIRNCAKRERDEENERTVFLLPDRGLIVNTSLCRDPELIREIQKQMKTQLVGFRTSYRKLAKRYSVLTGQITIDDLFKEA